MESLAYHYEHFVPLDSSKQVATKNSLTHEYAGGNLNQHNNQPVEEVQSQSNNNIAPPVNSNKKIQSCPVLPSPKSRLSVSQDVYNRIIQPQSSHSKCSDKPSLNLHWKTSLCPSRKALNLPFSYFKSPATSSSNFNKTPLSLEPNQRVLRSRLLLLKPDNSSSIPDVWVSPSLKSSEKVSSSLSPLQQEETTSLNIIWTSSSLRTNQKACSSTTLQTKSPKTTSLDCLWKSLLERNQKSLQSPLLKKKLQANKCVQTSPSLEFNYMGMSSPLPEPRLQRLPTVNSNTHVMTLPLSHLTLKKSSLSDSIHQSSRFPLFESKSQTIRLNGNFKALKSPTYHSKLNTTSPNDKYRPTHIWPFHPTLNTSGQSLSSIKHCIRSTASTLGSKLQSTSSFDFRSKTKLNKEFPWTFSYIYPCVVKGGTLPDDVVNKIINSISKTRIQRDICRQILFRRMRGRPNPHPGPRLSTAYTVCLACASCIKSHCNHRIGRKDPRCARLFVIPTPETTTEGKVVVKLLLILSLPEISSSLLFPMKDNQLDEALDNDLEGMEKMPQVIRTSQSGICQEKLSTKKKVSEQSQATEWLLYVKSTNALHLPSQFPTPSSSFSSLSVSSASSSSSSSSSCSALPIPPPPTEKACHQSPPPDRVFTKVLSYQHRLPQGVSWLEFICSKDYQPLEGKLQQSQVPSLQSKSVQRYISIKGTKGPSLLFKFFQKKFKMRNSD
ncbi:casein kinase II subunit alpha'-interacting protein [Dipodomys merriami]|uniref:casein kinase II subunit alpha'-interacting protein n=1 Tax=Dipodomys merriami TaxID=94247 RepID=UPI003856081D